MTDFSTRYTDEEIASFYDNYQTPTVMFKQFVQRVKQLGWMMEDAASFPLYKASGRALECVNYYNRTPKEDRGVSYELFYSRVVRGWEMKRAMQTKRVNYTTECRDFYDNYKGEKVDYQYFYARVVKLHWSLIKAISTPVVADKSRSKARLFYDKNIGRAKVQLSVFNTRVTSLKWGFEKALTTELVQNKAQISPQRTFYDNHPNPKVSYKTFMRRISVGGLSYEEAISMPRNTVRTESTAQPKPCRTRQLKMDERKELLEYYTSNIKKAKVNQDVFIRRVRTDKWDKERAISVFVEPSKPKPSHTPLMNAFRSMICTV